MFKFVRYALLTYSLAVSGSALGTTYYVAATGLDTNSGTSKTSPWLHAPGMTGCTGTCASTKPQPGDSVILRGGDTWHFSSSAGTVGLPWTWTWSGNATTTTGAVGGCVGSGCIYIGVDTTWYNSSVCGSSFCRPKMNGDNPLSTSNVSSCAYTIGNNLIYQRGQSYTIWDNFEMLGFCMAGQSGGEYVHHYGCYNTYKNFYMHGWTLAPDSTYGITWGDQLGGFAGTTSGSCPDGTTYPFTGNEFAYNIFDGSDSSPQGLETHHFDCYNVHHSYMTYVGGNNCNNMHLVHDTVIEYANEDGSVALSTSIADHGDTWQFYGEANSNNYFYNNVVRHIGTVAGIGINIIFEPKAGYTDTVFNNLIYDVTSGNFLTVSPSGSGGNVRLINNTFQMYASLSSIKCVGAGACSLSQNNHFVTDATAYTSGSIYNAPTTTTTDLLQTTSAATAAGYTSSSQYTPSTGTSPTVGVGTSWASSCAGLTDAGAATACASATTLACTYVLGSGLLNCPGQQAVARSSPSDIGAYSYSGLAAPTGLSATVR